MDYVVGSIAALISGNVTPNRPKLIRRALTPTKHPVSPNVTPKSEAVDDRSIFLSPSVQKKKAIVKKSPKRIFENPDLDVTGKSETTSPKAAKVKKHLVEDLESSIMDSSSILDKKSPSSKLDKSIDTASSNKKSKNIDAKVSNESTPKKDKRKSQLGTQSEGMKSSDITKDVMSPKTTPKQVEEAAKTNQTPEKKKRKSKAELNNSEGEIMDVNQTTQVKSPKKKLILETIDIENKENQKKKTPKANVNDTNSNEQGSKKKNKKRKKKAKKTTQEESGNKLENVIKPHTTEVEVMSEVTNETKNKKKNRKNKKKHPNLEIKPSKQEESEEKEAESMDKEDTTREIISPKKVTAKDVDDIDSDNESNDNEKINKDVKAPLKLLEVHGYESSDNESDNDDDSEEEEVSNIANPNAITEKDTDSEHDSDNEIESDIETSNAEALQTEKPDESSDDDDDEELPKKGKTKKAKEVTQEKNEGIKEINTEDEIKRTLFVGNVPFTSKCKKEIKKIFAQYGTIETVRIRTVPVKDARVTPKLAVIRNEIHPDRSTVNVYIKFADPDSVERALSENNRVLNEHHLRVTRSGATGVEHDPACAVFVGNLPFGIEDETLRSKFQRCGEVDSVRIVRDRKTNAGKGFGYVNFKTKDAVELALELSEEDLTVKNRIIRVKRCTMTLSKGLKKGNQSVKPQRNDNQSRSFGNNQENRNFGNNQQNRNFGNNRPMRGGRNNQGPGRSFGNNQRNFGNQGPRSFGNNQGQNRNFGNNQGRNFENQGRSSGNQGRSSGNQGRSFGNEGNEASGAARRLMNKRPHQESGEGPPNKRPLASPAPPPRDKKQRKEFVGITAEKKKKQKFDKGQKKKKALSEILTKKRG